MASGRWFCLGIIIEYPANLDFDLFLHENKVGNSSTFVETKSAITKHYPNPYYKPSMIGNEALLLDDFEVHLTYLV